MPKLNDSKFMQAAQRAGCMPKTASTAKKEDLSSLRGLFDKNESPIQRVARELKGESEPVFFMHPHTRREVRGWLVESTNKHATIEMGADRYTVPLEDIRKVGEKRDPEGLRSLIKEIFSERAMPKRADLQVRSVEPFNMGGDKQLLVITYSPSIGIPSLPEVDECVGEELPGAVVMDVDSSMPGRLAVVINPHSDEEGDTDYEEAGQEADEENEIACYGEADKTAAIVSKTAQSTLDRGAPVTPIQAATALLRSGDKGMMNEAIKTYFENNGSQLLLNNPNEKFDAKAFIAAAMPVVQRSNTALWSHLTEMVRQDQAKSNAPNPVQTPMTTEAPQSEQNNVGPDSAFNVGGSRKAEIPSPKYNKKIKPPKDEFKGPPMTEEDMSNEGWGLKTTMHMPDRLPKWNDGDIKRFTDNGIPPPSQMVFKDMQVYHFTNHGGYITAKVKFDPKVMKGRTMWTIQNWISSFVVRMCGAGRKGFDFGVIGPVYVTSIGKNIAHVKFFSSQPGPSAMATRSTK